MVEPLSIGGLPTEEQIERDGDKMLIRLLRGGRVKLIGVDAPNHSEHGPGKPCDACNSGAKLKKLDEQARLKNLGEHREHGLCLSCMRGTKHFQQCVEKVLRTMDERRQFCLMVKTAEIKDRAKRQRFKRAGARPNAKNAAFLKSLLDAN